MKSDLKKMIYCLPDEGKLILQVYRKIISLYRKYTLKLRLIIHGYNIPDPEQIYWIDPNRIVYHTNYGLSEKVEHNVFDMVKDRGMVYDGEWDKSDFKFTDMEVYKAIEEHIKNDVPWDKTGFYKNFIKDLDNGKTRWGCKNRKDIDKHFEYLVKLIENVKRNGYKPNTELNIDIPFYKTGGEISVNIGRNGAFLFQDGRHRLSIAKIHGVGKIPVQVLVRHKKWQKFREKVWVMAKTKGGGTNKIGYIYQPLLHPDLQDVPAWHNSEDRFEAIKRDLSSSTGKLLDIGANFGYFSHRFEDMGFDCIAVEHNQENVEVAEKVRIAENKKFTLIQGDILDDKLIDELNNYEYEIVLALNIFHHFIKTEETFLLFKKLLTKLCFKVMYFEPHSEKENQMESAYRNYSEREFIEFIFSKTHLKTMKEIYRADDGRKLFRLD